MLIQQASAQGEIKVLIIDGDEYELKQLAFLLMDAIDNESAEIMDGPTTIRITCHT